VDVLPPDGAAKVKEAELVAIIHQALQLQVAVDNPNVAELHQSCQHLHNEKSDACCKVCLYQMALGVLTRVSY
jgi:hypothetical protein